MYCDNDRVYDRTIKEQDMNKNFFKKALLAALACMMAFMLAACGNSSKEKTYIAVTEPTYPPFESTNDDGKLVGFDIDLIKAIAKDQGFKVKMKTMSFDSLVPAVEAGNADLIIAGFNETPDRDKHVQFSDPYYDAGQYYMVMKNSPINSEADFTPSTKVAVQMGTTTADYVKELQKAGKIGEVKELNEYSTCVLMLENGDVDAVAGDMPVLDEYMNKKADTYKLAGEISTAADEDSLMKIAVGKDDDELLDKINAGLKNVMKDGTYDKLCKKWGITGLDHK